MFVSVVFSAFNQQVKYCITMVLSLTSEGSSNAKKATDGDDDSLFSVQLEALLCTYCVHKVSWRKAILVDRRRWERLTNILASCRICHFRMLSSDFPTADCRIHLSVVQVVWSDFYGNVCHFETQILTPFSLLFLIFNQKKKPKKPKQSVSPPSESFHMHFSLRGIKKRTRSGGGERGGDQFEWHQIRGAPALLSLISNQRGEGLPWQCGQDRENGWSKAGWRGMQHLGCLLVFFKSKRGDNRRFSKCFTASLLVPTHHGFNSKAAEVISIPFWFILLHKVI